MLQGLFAGMMGLSLLWGCACGRGGDTASPRGCRRHDRRRGKPAKKQARN